MQQPLSPSALGYLGNLPVGALLAVEPPPSRIDRPGLPGVFLQTLRANLHASARHAVLGHTAGSFRKCSSAACREAADLIPEIDPVHFATTDAQLDAILGEVLADLEREGTPFLAPIPS